MHEARKIKPCPFCSYTKLYFDERENKVCVSCSLCKTKGPEFEFENIDEDNFTFEDACEFALQRWNTRPELNDSDTFSFDDDNSLDQAIALYMANKYPIESDFNVNKFLIACDLLSWMKKFKKE